MAIHSDAAVRGCRILFFVAMTFLFVPTLVHAASPRLTSVMPRGIQRDAEHVITFNGSNLADTQEILFYNPEHFEVTQIEDADARRRNNIVLLLKPRKEGMNMKSLRIEFTRKKYNLQRLVMVDAFDNETELSFSQVRLNAPIDDSVFDFQPPAGVEVIKPEGL